MKDKNFLNIFIFSIKHRQKLVWNIAVIVEKYFEVLLGLIDKIKI